MLKAAQQKALQKIVSTQEELQQVWNNPRRYKMPVGPRTALVTLCVVEERGELKWAAAVRILRGKRADVKPVSTWAPSERLTAARMLNNELVGVGLELGTEDFETAYALHCNKKLTPEERNVALRPHLLGN